MARKDIHLKLGKALYEKAVKDRIEHQVFHDLQSLNNLFYDRQIVRQLNNLAFAGSSKIVKTIGTTFGDSFSEPVTELLIFLIENYEVPLLGKIFAGYRRHYFEKQGIREVKLRTARELDSQERELIAKKMGLDNDKVHLTFRHAPDLIGGIQIYDQGRLTDLSVRNHLDKLRNHLIAQAKI